MAFLFIGFAALLVCVIFFDHSKDRLQNTVVQLQNGCQSMALRNKVILEPFACEDKDEYEL